MRNPMLHGNKHKQWGAGGGGGGDRELLGLFVKSFLPAFREKQHRHIFSHHTGRLAKFGWILTYLENSSRNDSPFMSCTQLTLIEHPSSMAIECIQESTQEVCGCCYHIITWHIVKGNDCQNDSCVP